MPCRRACMTFFCCAYVGSRRPPSGCCGPWPWQEDQRLGVRCWNDYGDVGRFEAGVRTAVEQHLIEADGSHRYTFRHALTAEAVLADTLPAERIRLHGALAASLETRLPAERAWVPNSVLASAYAKVACRWLGGRDRARALNATIEAGLAADGAPLCPRRANTSRAR